MGKTVLVIVIFFRSWQEMINKGSLQMNDGRALPYLQRYHLDTVSEQGRTGGSRGQRETGRLQHTLWGADKGGTNDRDLHAGKAEEEGLKNVVRLVPTGQNCVKFLQDATGSELCG